METVRANMDMLSEIYRKMWKGDFSGMAAGYDMLREQCDDKEAKILHDMFVHFMRAVEEPEYRSTAREIIRANIYTTSVYQNQVGEMSSLIDTL